MTYFNTAEAHGGHIDEPSKVTMIMETLPKSFIHFKSNYSINGLTFTLTRLMNELTHYESILMGPKPSGEVNVASSSKSEKKRKNPKAKTKAKVKIKKNKKSPKGTEPKGKYFHYNVDGHWKRNCSKYLTELKEKKAAGKYDLLVIESLLVEDDKSIWIIDSDATNHVCSSLQLLDS